MKFRKLVAGAVIAQGMAWLSMSAANADEILTYTGNDFTFASGPYTFTDKVTATIDLKTPLGDSVTNINVIPISFEVSDVQQSFDQDHYDPFDATFRFSTDPSGNITNWAIFVTAIHGFSFINSFLIAPRAMDIGVLDNGSSGEIDDSPGIWHITLVNTPVPEPSTISVLSAGLLGLVFLWRRRRQIRSPIQ